MPNNYFDNGATSFPKPAAVAAAMARYLNEIGGPYGRSAYGRALEVSRTVEDVRDALAELTGIADSRRMVFCANATHAANIVLSSLPLEGRHVLVSPLEHNAVMRPLGAIPGVRWEVLPHRADGRVEVERVAARLRRDTALVIVNHQGNVNGVVQPIREIKAVIGEVPLLVDAAQSIGHEPIRVDRWHIDYLAFTGHKALLGPTGTGGLCLGADARVKPLTRGGTGSNSEHFDMPATLPDLLEAGTPNIAGIFGLGAALANVPQPLHGKDDLKELFSRLCALRRVTLHAPRGRSGTLFSVSHDSLSCADLARQLYERHGIECRAGLHCAPLAHQTLGTFPEGTTRFSLSPYHRGSDLRRLARAMEAMDRR